MGGSRNLRCVSAFLLMLVEHHPYQEAGAADWIPQVVL